MGGNHYAQPSTSSALVDGEGVAKEVFTADGEGYDVRVILREDEWPGGVWLRLALPYTSDYACENRKDAVWPADLLNS